VALAQEWSRTGLATVRFPSPARRRVKARKPFWTTSKYEVTGDECRGRGGWGWPGNFFAQGHEPGSGEPGLCSPFLVGRLLSDRRIATDGASRQEQQEKANGWKRSWVGCNGRRLCSPC
jgi:hypothetical protein